MGTRYNLVGEHQDDKNPLVIGTFDTREEAEEAVKDAAKHDPNNNWRFYMQMVEVKERLDGNK
jgi:hypothetical protein